MFGRKHTTTSPERVPLVAAHSGDRRGEDRGWRTPKLWSRRSAGLAGAAMFAIAFSGLLANNFDSIRGYGTHQEQQQQAATTALEEIGGGAIMDVENLGGAPGALDDNRNEMAASPALERGEGGEDEGTDEKSVGVVSSAERGAPKNAAQYGAPTPSPRAQGGRSVGNKGSSATIHAIPPALPPPSIGSKESVGLFPPLPPPAVDDTGRNDVPSTVNIHAVAHKGSSASPPAQKPPALGSWESGGIFPPLPPPAVDDTGRNDVPSTVNIPAVAHKGRSAFPPAQKPPALGSKESVGIFPPLPPPAVDDKGGSAAAPPLDMPAVAHKGSSAFPPALSPPALGNKEESVGTPHQTPPEEVRSIDSSSAIPLPPPALGSKGSGAPAPSVAVPPSVAHKGSSAIPPALPPPALGSKGSIGAYPIPAPPLGNRGGSGTVPGLPSSPSVGLRGRGRGGETEKEGGNGGAGAGSSRAVGSGAPGKPNVFFIMVDDMGWGDIGYQSTDLGLVTPNLDKLASGGVKMTQYYTMSICTPARASLMTGRYTIRYGLQYNVIQPGAPWGLPLHEKILPEYMNDAGYESHMVGKWHLGSYTHSHAPYKRGFDTFLGYLNDEEMYWTHQSWSAKLNGHKFFDFGFGNSTGYYDIIDRSFSPVPIASDDEVEISTGPTSSSSSSSSTIFRGKYSTAVFQQRAMEILRSKSPYDEKPLFLYLAHQAVHDPLGLPPIDAFTNEEWAVLDEVENKTGSALRLRFAKVLMYMDKTIGELVGYLEAEGWMDNSIIVLASDNGGCPQCGGNNYPLRGVKHSYWEGGVKVPAFVYSRSHIPEERWGTEYRGLMHVTDWIPTLATAAGFDTFGSHGPFDGVDQWSHIVDASLADSDESPRTEMLYNFDPYNLWAEDDSITDADYLLPQGAFRQGKWKFLFREWCTGYYTFDNNVTSMDNLINSNTTCQEMGTCSVCGASCGLQDINYTDWLFDLDADPREQNNLITVFPEVAGQMRNRTLEIVFKEYTNSSYEDVDMEAFSLWREYNWWMVPWEDLLDNTTTTTSTTTTSGEDDDDDDGGEGDTSTASDSSWTSTVSSSGSP